MTGTAYDNVIPMSRLDREIDREVARINEEFANNPLAQRLAAEQGERWRQQMEAETLVGAHAVVLPVALADQIADALAGKPTSIPVNVLSLMVAGHVTNAERRA